MHKLSILPTLASVAALAIGGAVVAPHHAGAAAMQMDPGPPVTGATGPITNGTTAELMAAANGPIIAAFIGFSAHDTDTLTLPGFSPSPIFTNNVTPIGTSLTLVPDATIGERLPFTLNNTTTGKSFVNGTAYMNTDTGMFSPVYHFADFTGINNIADYNASPLAIALGNQIVAGGPVDLQILADGGYSAFTFVGVEDLQAAAADDWNDLVYAFTNVGVAPPSVPEPASLTLLGSALVGLGLARRRRNKTK